MSAYDNVTRVKSSQEKLHQHHLSHHNHNELQITRQRKWRILLAIGLLLPALAAIIGIVAWSISIEVATGGSTGARDADHPSRLHRKHLHNSHMHQHQPTNHLTKQLSAQLSAQTTPQQQPLYRQFRRHQPTEVESRLATSGEQQAAPASAEPVPASLFGGAPASSGGLVVVVGNSPKGETNSPPAAQPTKRRKTSKKTISESIIGYSGNSKPAVESQDHDDDAGAATAEEEDDQSSSLLLTNRNQLAALSSTSTTTEPTSTTELNPEERNDESDEDTSGADSRNDEKTERAAEIHDAEEQPEDIGADRNSAKPSRWLNSKAAGKRPIKLSSAARRHRQEVSNSQQSAESYTEAPAPSKRKAKPSIPSASGKGIKYIIVGKSQRREEASRGVEQMDEEADKSADIRGELAQQAPTRGSSPPPELGESPREESGKLAEKQREEQEEEKEEEEAKRPIAAQPDDEQLSFEAIASAISTTLSAEHTPAEKSASSQPEAASPSEDSLDDSVIQYKPEWRSRTAGEHVAEVIDHLVEHRKQRRPEGIVARGGPQIVVVAPVAGSELMKARSLTRESNDDDAPGKKAAVMKKAEELKKKEALVGLTTGKKRFQRPLGARLLGTLGETSPPSVGKNAPATDTKQTIKYSERVEVIEDDDSSPLLMKASPELDGLASSLAPTHEQEEEEEQQKENQNNQLQRRESFSMAIGDEQMSSIHVSSNSGEARSRSPRHGLPPGMAFERYAPVQPIPTVSNIFVSPLVPTSGSANAPVGLEQRASVASQPKLYSAEQVIREHVMRSKLRNSKPSMAPERNEQVLSMPGAQQQVANSSSQLPNGHRPIEAQPEAVKQQVKLAPTTLRPAQLSSSTVPTSAEQREFKKDTSRQQQNQQLPQEPERGFGTGVQSVQVPIFSHYNQPRVPPQMMHHHQHQPQQQARPAQEVYQTSESQTSNVVQQQQQQQQQQQRLQQQNSEPEQQQTNQQEFVASQANPQQDAIIQQQQAGQLPLFADQEYNVPAHMADTVIQDIQRSPSTINVVNWQPTLISSAGQVPHHLNQQHQQQQHHQPQQVLVAWNPQVAASSQRQQMMLAAARQMAALSQHQHQHQQFHPFPSSSGQVLANRAGSVEVPVQKQEAPAAIPARRGLGHPVAQFALRHLFQSLGQQAAAQEAQQQLQSRSMAPTNSQKVGPADAAQQGLSSAPAGSAPLPGPLMELSAEGSSNRQMRSLPGNGNVQPQQLLQDQEVQESSYGGHMQPAPYHPGGGQHYESEHDKKSKGITFHFGGGPIGGGTQLITSPMGIFKHLMIPLLPNPRVNLNGKVVFGVVLEKTTAFGEPKKKYKFWG